MSWSPQQEAAIRDVKAWLSDPRGKQVFRLFGYAGTGKTTLARELASSVRGTVLYATFTGKASLVLRSKGCHGAQTIHSLIYSYEVDEVTGEVKFHLNQISELATASLLVVDEVSMVGEELARDLLSFGKRILVLGDPAQLPPVKGEGYFINCAPDVMLTEVHRQARDNPIIRMSMDIREGKPLTPGLHGQSRVVQSGDISQEELRSLVLDADQLLCGLNRTRVAFNKRIRQLKGLVGVAETWHPVAGDRLICLKNKRDRALYNGSMWDVHRVSDKFQCFTIRVDSLDEDRPILDVDVPECFFDGTEHKMHWKERRRYDEFTFGWAITCHKSQGSQWPNVIVFDESSAFRESRMNWLYTAVTRAADRVTVIV